MSGDRDTPPRLPIEKEPVVCLIVVGALLAGTPPDPWSTPDRRRLLKLAWRELWPRCDAQGRALGCEILRDLAYKRHGKQPPPRREPGAANIHHAARVVGQ